MEVLIYIMIFILGSCLGSFFACIGYRIPNKISTIKPGSFCPNCKKPLKWYMNIPLFSYIFLRGKCAYCKKKINITYFIIELFTGLMYLLSYIYFSLSLEFFIMIIIISALSVTIVTDFNYYYISDRVIIISLILELVVYIYYLSIKEIGYYLLSGIVLFLIMLTIKFFGDKIFKRESLGGGDVKLVALIGMSLGIINAITSLIISSVLALISSLVLMKKNEEKLIPFGPFLLIGTIIMYILAFNNLTII